MPGGQRNRAAPPRNSARPVPAALELPTSPSRTRSPLSGRPDSVVPFRVTVTVRAAGTGRLWRPAPARATDTPGRLARAVPSRAAEPGVRYPAAVPAPALVTVMPG